MDVKMGVLADSQIEYIQEIFEQIGLKDCFNFVQNDFKQFDCVIIAKTESFDSNQQTMIEQYFNQGGRILLFIDGENKLPWGIQATRIATQGDAIVVKSGAKDIVGELAGLRFPLWFVPAIALKQGESRVKITEVARFYPQSASAIFALEHSAGRAIVCGFPLFKSLHQCASSPWPYGYGALVYLLKAMLNWLCQDRAMWLKFKYASPIAVCSFDMEEPIANRTIGKVLLKLSIPWSQGKSLFISTHRLQRILPFRRRLFASVTRSHSSDISTKILRIYLDVRLNRNRLFNPHSILMLQIECSPGKQLVRELLPQFKHSLLRIAEIFNKFDYRCTFFVPGVIIEAMLYDPLLQDLQAAGFEFGLHGYRHDHYGNMKLEEIDRDLRLSIKVFNDAGLRPLGNRCPGFSTNRILPQKLQKLGLLYDSSLTEIYENYPLLPVRNPSCSLPFYQVPISLNLYKNNLNLGEKIQRVAEQGGLLHLYGHDHEFHRFDSKGKILMGVLRKLQWHGFRVMPIHELLKADEGKR
ncbi:MAG: hypothetical protein DRP01_06250 [Archaeoglobales archaeon]|nr:MAG: hypothetical protein DRN92_03235 [Candidatus Korarchaeota archaeon]RLI85413.1 MAG: hypothetical protein DRP01_06250 [Archaeoglobales archaeon]